MIARRHRSLVVIAMLLLLLPCCLLAQRGRSGGRGATGANGANPAPTDSSDMQDFKRAVELQATADQTTQFQAMAKSTTAALESTQQFVDSKNGNPTALTGEANLFKLVMDDVNQRDQDFLASFSDVQKSGLKKLVKNVRKSESDANKQWKDLVKELGRTPAQDQATAAKAANLKAALLLLQAEQKNLGTEMGIDLSKMAVQPASTPVLTPR